MRAGHFIERRRRMRIWTFRNAAIGILAASPVAAMATPSYTAVILAPDSSGSYAGAIANGQEAGAFDTAIGERAALWTGSAASLIDLNPAGFAASEAVATDGTRQGGWGYITSTGNSHALLWYGTAASAVDLTPTGYSYAVVNAVAGLWQGGAASPTGFTTEHAALWQGSASSYVDLNPEGFDTSVINGMTLTQQIGAATVDIPENSPQSIYSVEHAILWNCSASNYVDLNPSWANGSIAIAIYGNYQGGQANGHATIWNGAAASAVDVNPTGIYESAIAGMSANYEVGYTYILGQADHAALWQGSANTWVDLQQYLPTQFITSQAFGIDAEGNVVGYATYNNQNYAVLWLAPEPVAVATLGLPFLAAMPRRRRKRLSR